jgi:hypothetical protein
MTRTIFTEEPGAGKLACPVLKTNGNREEVVEFNNPREGIDIGAVEHTLS